MLLGDEKIYDELKDLVVKKASNIKIGGGFDEGVLMGPVISARHKERVLSYIEKGIEEGADMLLDGREAQVDGKEGGYYLKPTIFENVDPSMTIAKEEIFGPVLTMMKVKDLDNAIELISDHPLANTISIFTTSGKNARKFKYNVDASMIGINIGVPAPMSFFTFGGAKGSFFGDLKAHGKDSIEFYTDKKPPIRAAKESPWAIEQALRINDSETDKVYFGCCLRRPGLTSHLEEQDPS